MKTRLDAELVRRELARSREQAARRQKAERFQHTKPEQQAISRAGRHGEENDGRGWFHRDSTLSIQRSSGLVIWLGKGPASLGAVFTWLEALRGGR